MQRNEDKIRLGFHDIQIYFVKIYIMLSNIHTLCFKRRHNTLLLQYRFCKDIYYTSEDAKLRQISLFKEKKRKHFKEGET